MRLRRSKASTTKENNTQTPVASSTSAPTATPIATAVSPYPTIANSVLWLDRTNLETLYSDIAGTTHCIVDDPIGVWKGVNAAWGASYSFVAPANGNRPNIRTDGVQSDGIDDELITSTPISINADFTLYLVMSRTLATQQIMPIAHATNDDTITFWGSAFYAMFQGNLAFASWAIDNWSGVNIVRIRRSGANAYYKYNGQAEQSLAQNQTLNWSRLLRRNSGLSHASSRVLQYVYVQRNMTAGDADDSAIISALQALEPSAVSPDP